MEIFGVHFCMDEFRIILASIDTVPAGVVFYVRYKLRQVWSAVKRRFNEARTRG